MIPDQSAICGKNGKLAAAAASVPDNSPLRRLMSMSCHLTRVSQSYRIASLKYDSQSMEVISAAVVYAVSMTTVRKVFDLQNVARIASVASARCLKA